MISEEFLYALNHPVVKKVMENNISEKSFGNCKNYRNSSLGNTDEDVFPCMNPNDLFSPDHHDGPIEIHTTILPKSSDQFKENFCCQVLESHPDDYLLQDNQPNSEIKYEIFSGENIDQTELNFPVLSPHTEDNFTVLTPYSEENSALFTPYSEDNSTTLLTPYSEENYSALTPYSEENSTALTPYSNFSPCSNVSYTPNYENFQQLDAQEQNSNNLTLEDCYSPVYDQTPSLYNNQDIIPGESTSDLKQKPRRKRNVSSSSTNSYVRAPRVCLKNLSVQEKRERVKLQNNDASARYRQRKSQLKDDLSNEISNLRIESSEKERNLKTMHRNNNILNRFLHY